MAFYELSILKYIKVKMKNLATKRFRAFVFYVTVAFMTVTSTSPQSDFLPAPVSIDNVGALLIPSAGDPVSKAVDQSWRVVYIPLGTGAWDLLWESSLWGFFNPGSIFGKHIQSEFIVINSTTVTWDGFSYSKIYFHSEITHFLYSPHLLSVG